MKFSLKLSSSNAAFVPKELGRDEVARILRAVAASLENGREDGILQDINGNSVGSFELK